MAGTLWPRIMLTGKNGQVGWELQRTLAPLGDVVALGREELDLTDPDQIRAKVREIRPSLIVNPAAYTAVDQAEDEPELAMAVNGVAPGILAEEAKRIGAGIVHYSTDYVFDGTKTTPYTEEDEPNPINVYGRTKLAGEEAVQAVDVPHLILRVGWVYGLRGRNFLRTILRLAQERDEIKVVDDQIGSPTWCRMIAEATALILAGGEAALAEKGGIYHLSAGGQTSWYGFAKAIMASAFRDGGGKANVVLIRSVEYSTVATRPAYSVLSNDRMGRCYRFALPGWNGCLSMVFDNNCKNGTRQQC